MFCFKIFVGISDEWDALFVFNLLISFSISVSDTVLEEKLKLHFTRISRNSFQFISILSTCAFKLLYLTLLLNQIYQYLFLALNQLLYYNSTFIFPPERSNGFGKYSAILYNIYTMSFLSIQALNELLLTYNNTSHIICYIFSLLLFQL